MRAWLLVISCWALCALGAPSVPIFQELQQWIFLNSGVVQAADHFSYEQLCSFYVEGLDKWNVHPFWKYLFRHSNGSLSTPPIASRKLGGLGAGTFELRADGSVHEWEIINNTPASGKKIQIQEDFVLAIRTSIADNTVTRMLQTHPPDQFGIDGVQSITYSGSYPASRLIFYDADLPVQLSLYAFSEFDMWNPTTSNTPAVAFTFFIDNSQSHPVNVSLLMSLPSPPPGNGTWHVHLVNDTNGNGTSQLFTVSIPGTALASGNMTLSVASVSGVHVVDGDTTVGLSFATAVNATHLLKEFASSGKFPSDSFDDSAVGALAYEVVVPPTSADQPAEITLLLSYYMPYRTYSEELVGNYYANTYRDSEHVAISFSERISQIAANITKWHTIATGGPHSSLPVWLQDALINSASTMAKTGMWLSDGRWRQFESFSCDDLDPTHIHFYRSLPYALFFPELTKSLLEGYAVGQEPDGRIQEWLASGCGGKTGKLDKAGGRMMGDTSTVFILDAFQIWQGTGDEQFLQQLWPSIRAAAQWQIDRSRRWGLPDHLQTTYDWFFFEKKDVVAYNAFLHMAALAAAGSLATTSVVNETEFAEVCEEEWQTAQQAVWHKLWFEEGGYFRAWWNASLSADMQANALHTDTLYGQLWAYVLGIGALLNETALLEMHLKAEQRINGSPYGLMVMWNGSNDASMDHSGGESNSTLMNGTCPSFVNNLVWNAGSIDWSALRIYLGDDPMTALTEAQRVIERYREDLSDFWDWKDITAGTGTEQFEGLPWCNSHYARQVILWVLPLALTGQHFSASDGILSFSPKLAKDNRGTYPFFVPGGAGLLEVCDDVATISLVAGELQLQELSVFGSSAFNIHLMEGQSVELLLY